MRVLHILNGLEGGATVSILEVVRESRALRAGIEHYSVLPGDERTDCGSLKMFWDVRTIPMGPWYRPEVRGAWQRLIRMADRYRSTIHSPRAVRRISRAIREWGIDLVTTNCAANIEGAIAAQRTSRPHVWHIRERVGSDGSLRFRTGDRALAHRIGGLSARIAAVSNYTAEPFVREGLGHKVEVVYDGIDIGSFMGDEVLRRAVELRRAWLQNSPGPLIGSVSNVTGGVKRHEVLLKTFAELARSEPDLRFVVVGRLPEKRGPLSMAKWKRWVSLQKMCNELGLETRLTWAGHMDDIAAVMNALDVVVHGCEIEGLGRTVLEAMAAAKPVVAPDSGGVTEVVKNMRNGILVPPLNAQELAQGVRLLLDNPDLANRLADAARKRVEQAFQLNQHVATMVGLYQSTLTEARREKISHNRQIGEGE